MKRFYLMIFTVVTLVGMLAISGCQRDDNEQNGRNGRKNRKTGMLNGHEWVDLGLPSGVRWATCNVGATTPEGYGDYFAWGETTAKETYNWSTYRYCNGDYNTLTKYCNNSNFGTRGYTDALTILEASDDAATVNWGAGWRMPTQTEINELYRNCTYEWTAWNDINGCLFTGPNGNSIFLPAAGYLDEDNLNRAGAYGFYYSSSLYTRPDGALVLYFNPNGCYYNTSIGSTDQYSCNPRYSGSSVRPVYHLHD